MSWLSRWWMLLPALAACSDGASSRDERVNVFAAASLTEALGEVVTVFGQRHDGVAIAVNLAGSNQLALQIEQGAPADIFISANPHWMTYLADRDLVEEPIPIARNTLVIAIPGTNPGGMQSWKDLARAGTLVVRAADAVPAGRYADSTIAALDRRQDAPGGFAEALARNVVSHEESVKGVVAKLLLGEADAGFVYRTDVTQGNGLRIVALPEDLGATDDYLMALTRGGPSSARIVFDFLQSETARSILRHWGFGSPVTDAR